MKSIKIKASGKINLVLSVLGKREDGFHELDSIMQSVSLYDTVKIKKSEKLSVACREWSGEQNICFKAAEKFFRFAKIDSGAEIEIEKKIPSPAGLGGGSADAAAVLVGLNRLYEAGLSNTDLIFIAKEIGADVPFLIEGGTKRAKGIGEKLENLSPFGGFAFLIAKNGQKPSTGEMFKRLDSMDYTRPNTETAARLLNAKKTEEFLKCLGNSFEALYPDTELEGLLRATDPLAVSLSGSGPSFFAIYKNEAEAEAAAEKLKGTECFVCLPTEKSLIIE